MKNLFFILLSVIYFLFFTVSVSAANYPTPTGFVNDFAGLYSATFKINLESKLREFSRITGNEISVVTIKSLEGSDIESYAVTLFEKWKIGKKGKDNGLLLLIAKNDRKVRIEVGYGLEPIINDGRAGEIIRNQITPEFKKENYEGGTQNAVDQIITFITNNDIAPSSNTGSTSSGSAIESIVTIGIIIFFIAASYLGSYLGRTKEIWPGGIIGGILGGLGGLVVASVAGLIIGALVFGPLVLLLDYILTKNYQVRKSRGLPTGFFSTWGGFGGGGGGGFGGFGGGSSGGGGASGGW